MAGIKGAGTSFKLDNASNVLTDISTFLDGVEPSSEPEELDGTTFQPNVAAPTKDIVAGFRTRGVSLSGKWSPAAEAFFAAIEGLTGLDYEHGPDGTTAGKTKVSGLCNCLSYTGPQSTIDGIITFSAELRISTRVVGTY